MYHGTGKPVFPVSRYRIICKLDAEGGCCYGYSMLNLEEEFESLLTPEEKGIRSGAVKNCFIRLEDDPPVVSIFCPRVDEEDYRIIKDARDESVIENWVWNDSGIQFRIKETDFSPAKYLSGIIEKITGHFAEKYPDNAFKKFQTYICGNLSTVILIHVNNDFVLKYCEELRRDFVKNFLKVVCNIGKDTFKKIFVNTYEFGTLELRDDSIEMRRWESEDEAQEVSYLSRHYTQRLSDGVMDDPEIKTAMTGVLRESLEGKTVEREHLEIFLGALKYLDKFSL
jgi:hypothetical protein